MRKLVLAVLALIALFSALRAYTQALPAAGVQLHPGLVEIGDGVTSVGISFGVAEKTGAGSRTWSILPLRVVYRSGPTSVTIGLNGLSFLLRGGVSVGRPVRVDSPRVGDVISIGGRVTVDARVDGDIWSLGADVELSPRAVVTGNVVALGGKVAASAKSVVRGTVSQVPEIKIPFLGVLGTQFSMQAVSLARQIISYLLFALALFLTVFYRGGHARGLFQSLPGSWRESVIGVAVSLPAVPLAVVLLVASVIGVFFIPVLVVVIVVVSLDGFLLVCARLGAALRRGGPDSAAGAPLTLFTSGLLGLFLVKVPALAGIGLTLLTSDAAVRAGTILQLVTLGCVAAGLLYGWGAGLARARGRGA
jgi:hypothetical protein